MDSKISEYRDRLRKLDHYLLSKADLSNLFRSGKLNLIQRYLDVGFGVDSVGDKQYTALHYALEHQNLMVVKALMDAGANINAKQIDGCPEKLFVLNISTKPTKRSWRRCCRGSQNESVSAGLATQLRHRY